jgi:hypothetical protein
MKKIDHKIVIYKLLCKNQNITNVHIHFESGITQFIAIELN